MNKNFIFFVIACALLILSIIAANVAPIIGKAEPIYKDTTTLESPLASWETENCQKLDDEYNHAKDNHAYDDDSQKPKEDLEKRKIKECKHHKAMYSLEYAALIIDLSLGFICTVLGLIYYLEPGKPLEKESGLIGLIAGVITAVLTIVYVAFSALIFSNEPIRGFYKLYPNKASLKLSSNNKYIPDYDEEKVKDDLDIPFIKYKDLGKKQYNYDSELFESSKESDSEYNQCTMDKYNADPTTIPLKYTVTTTNDHDCLYIWDHSIKNESTDNKYLYDRWLTCIILCVLIAVCGIGLAIFGLLLFTGSSDSQPSPSTVPQQS